ncbi:MAG: hypothetical protein HY332_20405 [Chloroflexi bacterium]|nr:hypothetical protein [Chloroflexota bacterium]
MSSRTHKSSSVRHKWRWKDAGSSASSVANEYQHHRLLAAALITIYYRSKSAQQSPAPTPLGAEVAAQLSDVRTERDQLKSQVGELEQRISADDWLVSITAADRNQLSAVVYAFSTGVNLDNLNITSPFIDFIFDVVNGSVFTVLVANQVAGHVIAPSGLLKDVPELGDALDDESTRRIPHAEKRQVRLRQWLQRMEADAIITKHTPHALVTFNLTNVVVRVKAENHPAGKAVGKHKLHLESVTTRMPPLPTTRGHYAACTCRTLANSGLIPPTHAWTG